MTCELCNLPGCDREIPRGSMFGDRHYLHTFCARIEGMELLKGAERDAWLAAEAEALAPVSVVSGPLSGPHADPILEIVRSLSLGAALISESCSERLADQLEAAFERSEIDERSYAGSLLTLHAITADAWQ